MQERGKRAFLSFCAARRTRSSALDTPCPALCPGRALLAVFPSSRPLSSTISSPLAGPCSTASHLVRRLRRYYGPVGLPRVVHRGLTASAFASRGRHPAEMPARDYPGRGMATTGPPFSHSEIPHMHRFFDRAGSTDGSRMMPPTMCLPRHLTTSASETTRFAMTSGSHYNQGSSNWLLLLREFQRRSWKSSPSMSITVQGEWWLTHSKRERKEHDTGCRRVRA